MRKFDTKVQHLKYKVLREVARQAWNDTLLDNIFKIPSIIVPGKTPTMRCCVYKERAILQERVRIAMGGDKENPNVIEVIDIASRGKRASLIYQQRAVAIVDHGIIFLTIKLISLHAFGNIDMLFFRPSANIKSAFLTGTVNRDVGITLAMKVSLKRKIASVRIAHNDMLAALYVAIKH